MICGIRQVSEYAPAARGIASVLMILPRGQRVLAHGRAGAAWPRVV